MLLSATAQVIDRGVRGTLAPAAAANRILILTVLLLPQVGTMVYG
jgi:hypothetical protein